MEPEKIPEEKVPETTGEKTEVKKEETQSPLHSLRTYQGDIEEIMSHGKGSISSIVVAEQKRKEKILDLPKEQAHTVRRNTSFVSVGIVLALLGVGAVATVLLLRQQENQVVLEQKTKALIAYSQEKDIFTASSTREALVTALVYERDAFSLPLNSVLYINTTDGSGEPENVSDILKRLTPQMPASLARTWDDEYMIGQYGSFGSSTPFVILTTSDYAGSYAGMLKWEETMVLDIGGLFSNTITVSTTTPVFTDKALQNKDLRILRDTRGDVVLLYSFLDRNTLVITGNESAFTGIVGKYLINKTVR